LTDFVMYTIASRPAFTTETEGTFGKHKESFCY